MNQNRINQKNEQIYLLGLKQEFSISKNKLKELIHVNEHNYNGAIKILEQIAHKKPHIEEKDFLNLLFDTFSSDVAFNPNNSLLIEIISSGNLKNISNPTLRIQLTSWISTLEDISRQEKDLEKQREYVLNLLRSNKYSLGTIFKQASVYDALHLPPTAVNTSNLNLLESTEFKNNLLMFVLASHATEEAHYLPLMQDLMGILEIIEQEIDSTN